MEFAPVSRINALLFILNEHRPVVGSYSASQLAICEKY